MKIVQDKPAVEFRTVYSIADDITGYKHMFVNYYFIGRPGINHSWWLVDAGMPGASKEIIRHAQELFGQDRPPEGIILTHGHFDHIGGLGGIIKKWPSVPIYAHSEEIPFIHGDESYPAPDPSVGGGMSRMSWMFPLKGMLKHSIQALSDNEIPGLQGWTYIETPGHSPGHISLFRERDRMLLAGDAFVTTNQNSIYSAMSQRKEMHAPPAYMTIHWSQAKESIRKLLDLKPEAAGTGHGLPFFREHLRHDLRRVLETFETLEMPVDGHYVKHPVDKQDVRMHTYRKPQSYRRALNSGRVAGVAAAGVGLMMLINRFRRMSRSEEHSGEDAEYMASR